MPFIDEISGLAIIKLLDLKNACANTMKVKFIRNIVFLDETNNSSEQLIFSKDEAWGIVGLKSIRYYEVEQSVVWHWLKVYCEFKAL